MSTTVPENFRDGFTVTNKSTQLDDRDLQISHKFDKLVIANGTKMSEKSETEAKANNATANNFPHEATQKAKVEENNAGSQEGSNVDKKDKFPWQFGENVKRDSFGFIIRTDTLPLDKSKSHESNNVDSSKGKSDKKSEKGKGEDRYDEGKKSDRERRERDRDRDKHRDRDRDRSPYSYKRKYSRSPSPRRSRHRRSRSRSRTPTNRDPRLRRHGGSSNDHYRYRRYSSEKSPDKESDKSDLRSSSPRRERSRSPMSNWRSHNRSGDRSVDPRNPPMNMTNRQDYGPMAPPAFHPAPANPVPPPNSNSPGTIPPGPESNAFNRYQPNTAAPVPPPAQYNYPPGPGSNTTESYPSYEVYYQGYHPPPPAHPQPEYIPPCTNNWQGDVSAPPKPATTAIASEDPAKKEAIEKELLQQKITLSKQRDEYLRKGIILNRELELLKAQKKELVGDKTRDCEKLLKENNKLQLEINSKIKAVDNVIDILTGIIGDQRPTIPLEEKPEVGGDSSREKEKPKEKTEGKKKTEKRSKESSPSGGSSSSDESSSDSDSEYRKKHRKNKKKKRRAETSDENLAPPGTESCLPVISESRKEEAKPVCNFIYYDPEMHWCQVCDEFPRTAKEYLNHLHSKEHKELTQEKKVNDMPWHDLNAHEEIPFYEGAPTKRIPIKAVTRKQLALVLSENFSPLPYNRSPIARPTLIIRGRMKFALTPLNKYFKNIKSPLIMAFQFADGLQFLVSATAWFCKLCRVWIGDLHCASLHLKSKEHSTNYSSFNEQNPHWETDWMANREKAYEKCAEQRRRQRDEELLQKQKQERMELMKKQEEELKQKFFSTLMKPESSESELIMPLTLPRSFESSSTTLKENVEVKKEKEKKKKAKKEKKKKEKRMKEKKKKSKEKKTRKSSSSESGTSSESSTESSDSEEEKKYKKEMIVELEDRSKSIRVAMRNKEKEEEKPVVPVPVSLPEKSKWEVEEAAEVKPPPPPETKEVPEPSKEQQPPKKEPVDDKILKEWMKVEVPEPEKELARSLKEKIKTKEKQKDSYSKIDEDRSSRYEKKRSYRDRRQERERRSRSPRRERRASWDRKKDYRSSRHRRSRTRSRSRSYSREREREKVTPGVIPAPLYDLFKLDKHGLPDSGRPERPDHPLETDDGESKFEKQAMEAAKKKKVQPTVTLPKSKFGFIGRMPFAKKRSDSDKGKKDDEDEKKEDSVELEAPPPPRITQPRPPSPSAPKPVLTNKTKVETAKEIVSKYQKAFQEKMEESIPPMDPVVMAPEMIPICPMPIANPPLPPSPPVLTMMPPSPPKIRESPKSPKKTKKSPFPLPKDFQDALSIIYPEEKPEDKTEGYLNPELMNTLSFQPPPMGYGGQMMMAYPGMMMAAMPQMPPGPPPPHLMDASTMSMFSQTAPPPPTNDPSRETPSPVTPAPPENLFETSFGLGSSTGGGIPGLDEDKMETSSRMSDDDMALLGIDAGDMAAQQL